MSGTKTQAQVRENANVIALARGYRYRLELSTAAVRPAGHEFATSLAAARTRMRQLRAVGYVVTIFRITNLGGLDFV